MQSIFVWKSETPLTHSSALTYYSGSYWFMEEFENQTKSYQYHYQDKINDAIVWRAEKMGTDWVGSQLLDIKTVPYEKIKEDSYAILEHIGNWVRCIVKKDIEWNSEMLQNEYNCIKQWMKQPSIIQKPIEEPCMIRFTKPKTINKYANANSYNKCYNFIEIVHEPMDKKDLECY